MAQSNESRLFYDALTVALTTVDYSGDGHYLRRESPQFGHVKISDYMVMDLLLCDDRLPDRELREQALRLGQPCIDIQNDAPGHKNAYIAAIPETLRPNGIISSSVLDHTLPDRQTGEPVVWRIVEEGTFAITALARPFEDLLLAEIYANLPGRRA